MNSRHCLWAATALVLFTTSCSSNRQSLFHAQLRSAHAKLQPNTSPATQTLDRTSNPALVQALSKVTTFHDLLELDQAVQLEVTDASIVTDASQILKVDQRWIILDNPQNTIFSFGADGTYIGRIGRKGQGPGEYGKAMYINSWKEGLVIVDSDRGNLLIYDHDGQHQQTLNTTAKGYILTHECLEIDNRLYLSYFQAADAKVPLHLVLNLDGLEPLWGFGKRIPHSDPVKHISYLSMLRKVDNTLWSSRPHLLSDLNIYDLEGRFLRKVPSGMNSFGLNDFADLDDKKAREKRSERPRLYSIIPQGELVVVIYTYYQSGGGVARYYTNVYDKQGNLLKKIEPTTNPMLALARGYTDSHIVVGIDMGYLPLTSLEKWLQPQEMGRLMAAGFDPDNRENDNPWLLLYKVKPQMTPGENEQ